MTTHAVATLHTPWDCRWSRFGRRRSLNPHKPVEGLWVCIFSTTRIPINAGDCEMCPYWEFQQPLETLVPLSNASDSGDTRSSRE